MTAIRLDRVTKEYPRHRHLTRGLKQSLLHLPDLIRSMRAERFLALGARIGRILTIEEHVIAGGFGSAVSELFVERGAKVELEILGVPDEWVDHGAQRLWRKHFGLDAEGIAAAVRRRWPQLARDVAERESAG